jgi:hypothetical protein
LGLGFSEDVGKLGPVGWRVAENAMITVLRKWLISEDKLEEFKLRWSNEVLPRIRSAGGTGSETGEWILDIDLGR